MTLDLEDRIAAYLEENSLESLLEQLNISPLEAITLLFEDGQIDEEILERLV